MIKVGNFSLYYRVQTDSGAHPASYPMGTRSSFPEGEADHSPPSNAEVKNEWSYTSTPKNSSWRGAWLKHKEDFTFTFKK
jgi:hypothetical protein